MRALIEEHSRFVARTLRRGGVPRCDLDDEMQRTFIVAASRLDDVQPEAERSFLFQVARNTAAHTRRTLARRREFPSDHVPERTEPLGTPEDVALRRQAGKLLEAALAGLSGALRSVVVLYELEEMDSHEIAAALGIPRGTVASRLRRGRRQLRRDLAAIELALDLGIAGKTRVEGPDLLRQERVGALARALLRAGGGPPVSAAVRERILAVCLRTG
jgi:RNA polymerase sigma-70 factor (ECF subfamily)